MLEFISTIFILISKIYVNESYATTTGQYEIEENQNLTNENDPSSRGYVFLSMENEQSEDIFSANKCGGFFYPGSEKKFIDADSPLFKIHFKISKIRIAIETFKQLTEDFSKKIAKRTTDSPVLNILILSLRTVGSFSESNLGCFESYISQLENFVVLMKYGFGVIQTVGSYAETYCENFEISLANLNDRYRKFLENLD